MTYKQELLAECADLELKLLRVQIKLLELREERRQTSAGLLAPPPELLQAEEERRTAEAEVEQLRVEFGKMKTELKSLLAKAEKGERVEIDISFLIDRCSREAGGRA